MLCTVVLLTSGAYVEIYRVSPTVKLMTRQILSVYAMAAPFKVLNMILGGGILRSGGRTAYVMGIDMLGTWAFWARLSGDCPSRTSICSCRWRNASASQSPWRSSAANAG